VRVRTQHIAQWEYELTKIGSIEWMVLHGVMD
jgi:hypothetical protein